MNFSGHLQSLVTGLREWVGLLVSHVSVQTTAEFPTRTDRPAQRMPASAQWTERIRYDACSSFPRHREKEESTCGDER